MLTPLVLAIVARSYNNGVSQKPALGWNTWCTMGMCGQAGVSPGKMSLHDVCNETEIKSVAEAMVSSGLYAMGYDRINLDDCWVGEDRGADGSLAWDPLRFPNGMKPVIDWLHARGLKFGLYSSMGNETCNNNGRTWPGNATGTWPRHGSFGYYKEDAQTFADWGVSYLKYDNCFAADCKLPNCGNDASSTIARYTAMSNALNRTGKPILFSMCEWGDADPGMWGPAVSNSWRTTADISDVWVYMCELADLTQQWFDRAGP